MDDTGTLPKSMADMYLTYFNAQHRIIREISMLPNWQRACNCKQPAADYFIFHDRATKLCLRCGGDAK
mgnify:CR=1 FL=1